jgi:hypothetical protein
MLSTSWVPRSRTKLRSSRGEYWPEAIWRATMVRANTRPVAVIMVDDTTISSDRASSAVPWKARVAQGESWSTSTRQGRPGQQEHHHRDRRQHPQDTGEVVQEHPTPSEQVHPGGYRGGRVATNTS